MNLNTKKILKEYGVERKSYEKFTASVAALLKLMLGEGYKYHLDTRVKDLESLQKKIERKTLKGKTYEKLSDITDIAGVRIIFYTENDRKRFLRKMRREFGNGMEIKERAKISGYRAIHAIVALPDYDLRCEVQLSLILEHAWAEIEHDILYKEDWGFRELDTIQYINMKERMSTIMKDHIAQASDELERVVSRFKKLKREKAR